MTDRDPDLGQGGGVVEILGGLRKWLATTGGSAVRLTLRRLLSSPDLHLVHLRLGGQSRHQGRLRGTLKSRDLGSGCGLGFLIVSQETFGTDL